MELRSSADFFVRSWEQLVGRLSGPMKLRLLLQPASAAFFAIRAGLEDAREGRAPYLWSCVTDSRNRRETLRRGWKNIRNVFVIAMLLDCFYQIVVLREFHPTQALIVASTLALVPYLILRGPVNRMIRKWPGTSEMPKRKAG